jgi:GTP-binding protein
VGKSSLINLLAEQKGLAMVSDKPGKTKLINFFIMNGSWCLVDLPGYGYASASKLDRHGFNVAVADYIEQRETLRTVFVLIDSRLEPQKIDLDFLHAANVQVFLARLTEWREQPPTYYISSSVEKTGRGDVLNHIDRLLAKRTEA